MEAYKVKRRGWWAWHEYPKRRTVEQIIEFAGWKTLQQIVRSCELQHYDGWRLGKNGIEFVIMRDKALIVTLFLTGGRVNEVLELKPSNFDLDSNEEYIIVRGMPLEKVYVYETLREPVFVTPDEYANIVDKKHFKMENIDGEDVYVKRWHTKKNIPHSVRKDFPIFKFDPFIGLFTAWIEQQDNEEYLFGSTDIRREGKPITSTRAYQIIMNVGRICGVDIFPHWFRAQRASQLFKEMNLGWEELKLWFSWRTDAMAEKYARFSVDDLAARMLHKRSLIR